MGDVGLGKVCFDEALEDFDLPKYKTVCVGRWMKLLFCKFLLNTSYYGMFISHSPSLWFLLPCITILLFLINTNFFLSNNTLQYSSHSCPRDITDTLMIEGITTADEAFFV